MKHTIAILSALMLCSVAPAQMSAEEAQRRLQQATEGRQLGELVKQVEALQREVRSLESQLAHLQRRVSELEHQRSGSDQGTRTTGASAAPLPRPQTESPRAPTSSNDALGPDTPRIVLLGSAMIEVLSASIDRVEVRAPSASGGRVIRSSPSAMHQRMQSALLRAPDHSYREYLVLKLRITNNSGTNTIDYESFSGGTASGRRNPATLRDAQGNIYKPVTEELGTKIVGPSDSASIDPRQSIDDVLVFERPDDNVTRFALTLPGENVGGVGVERIVITLN